MLLWKFWSLLCKFHHSTNPFLHVVYCSVFHLAAFFMLHIIGLSLFFNAFQHRACYPSSCVSSLLSISPYLAKSSSYLLPIFSWYEKASAEFDSCGWLQSVALWQLTLSYYIYMKMQMYLERLYRLICHSLYSSSTLS